MKISKKIIASVSTTAAATTLGVAGGMAVGNVATSEGTDSVFPSLDKDFDEYFDIFKMKPEIDMQGYIENLNKKVQNLSEENNKNLALSLIQNKFGLKGTQLTEEVYIRKSNTTYGKISGTDEKVITQDKLLSAENVVGVTKVSTLGSNVKFEIEVKSAKDILTEGVSNYIVSPYRTTEDNCSIVHKIVGNKFTISIDLTNAKGFYFVDKVYNSKDEFLNDIENYVPKFNESNPNGVSFVIGAINDNGKKTLVFSSWYRNVELDKSTPLSGTVSYDFNDTVSKWTQFSWNTVEMNIT